MELNELKEYLHSKLAVTEELPFGPETLVYKVCGKMYALVAWQETPLRITLKADPAQIDLQRAMFTSVGPGYYMNKRHWISIYAGSEISADLIHDLIQDSYLLVAKTLNRVQKNQLNDSDK